MSLQKGLISVIMSNYNTAEEYLREAIESVLNQTYSNFEFIIVDDCSTDNSLEIIKSYRDPRIIIIENEENLGLTKSINRAVRIAKGEFLARMDADDVCMPERFQKQIDYMNENSSLIVCGTWAELFGDGAYIYRNKYSKKIIPEREIFQICLLFGNHHGLHNNVAFFRHQTLIDENVQYNEKYPCAQDYRMWVECSKKGDCQNVSEVLVKIRYHDRSISSAKKALQTECTKNIISEQLSWIGLELPDDWETIHYGLLTGRKPFDLRYKKWIKTIIKHNKKYNFFNQQKLKKILWNKWSEIVYFELAKANAINKIKAFLTLPLFCYPELLNIHNKRLSNKRV